MGKVFVWDENQVWQIDHNSRNLPAETGIDRCKFEKNAAELFLDGEQTPFQIPYGSAASCKNKLAAAYKSSRWSVFPLTESQIIGRAALQMPGVSASHFSVSQKNGSWVLEDLDSANGTYLNGRRIHQAQLKEEDWIFAGGISCCFLDGWLLIQRPACQETAQSLIESEQNKECGQASSLEAKNLPICCMPDLPAYGTGKLILEVNPERIDLEPPSFSSKPEKRSIAQAAGPAVMILCSSLASSAAALFGSAQSFSPAMLLSPVFMAAAFGGYGLFNRKLQKNADQRRRQENEQSYLSYLNACHLQAAERMKQKAQAWTEQKNELLDLDWKYYGLFRKSEDWMLPAGTNSVSAAAVKEPRIGYENLCDPITEEIARISSMNYAVPVWKVIQKGSFAMMQCSSRKQAVHAAKWIFALWSWLVYSPGRRFAWIGIEPSVPQLPGWMLDGKLLHFQNEQEWQQLRLLYPQIEWTVCASSKPDLRFFEEFSSKDYPPVTWICFPQLSLPDTRQAENQIQPSDYFSSGKLFEEKNPDWRKVRMSYMERNFTPAFMQDDWRVNFESICISSQPDLQVHPGPGICWNLDEDGPHVLAAGTTGSGKSEGLLSLLMELVLKNTAKQVQLILVDFKGGAFAGPFEMLPHLAGLVTNLDQGAVGRLIDALENELTERQKKIAQWAGKNSAQTADLTSYNLHNPDNSISHLFVVIDEFAQMKTRYPESMQQLQEAARIGRSLGLHLILCTQKPAGIVDEQIWSNTRSKICFQVAGKSDSREMIQSDQAAMLKQPGEFILMTPSRPLQKSRSFYLRSPMKGRTKTWIEDEKGKVIFRPAEGTLWLEKLQGVIEKRGEERRWILFPDPAFRPETLPSPMIDEISRITPWQISSGENLLIGARREDMSKVIESLCCMEKQENQTVYLWNSRSDTADQMMTVPGLWMLAQMQCRASVILAADASLPEELLEKLCANPEITVMAVFDEAGRLLEKCKGWFGLRAAAGLIDRDLRYALFETVSMTIEEWPVMRIRSQGSTLRVIFPIPDQKAEDRNKDKRVRKKRIALPALELDPIRAWDLPFGLIGIREDQQQPVFWKGTKPLLVMYSGQNGQVLMNGLMDFWMAQDPLCQPKVWPEQGMITLCCLEKAAANPAALKASQEGCDLLYLGTEFSLKQFQTGIKGLLCQQGNAVFQTDQSVFDLKVSSLKETGSQEQEEIHAHPHQHASFTGCSSDLY